jgi:DNA-binding beta-propeller fold protein YncE
MRVWPPLPEPARIELLGQFQGPRDLGLRSAGSGFLRILTGSETTRFERPYAVAVHGAAEGTGPGEAAGPARIAVTDTGTRVVHLFELKGGRHRILSSHEDGRPLESPVAAAFDAAGRLYVCDSVAALLLRYGIDGEFERILARGLARPAGLAVDSAHGVIYVADAAEHVVRRFDLEGRPLGDLGTPFRFPTHLATDASGRLAVSDSLGFRVVVLDHASGVLAEVGGAGDGSGNLQRPKGVGLDSAGHLYAVDALFDNVQIFDLDSRFLLSFGSAGGDPGEFALPAGLAVDDRDLIYVADTYNSRVQVFRYVGEDTR